MVIGTGCIGSYISNYHTITTDPIIGLVKIRRLKLASAMVKVYIAALWEIHYHRKEHIGISCKHIDTIKKKEKKRESDNALDYHC